MKSSGFILIFRYLTGYVIGFFIFALLMPGLLIVIHRTFDNMLDINLIPPAFPRDILSVILLVLGSVFAIWSNVMLAVRGSGGPTEVFNVAISPRTQKLVTTGPYRFTRNPMVFGMLCIYSALSVYLNSLSDIIFLIVFILLVHRYLKRYEEDRLEQEFGDEFHEYKRKTPFLFPFLMK